MKRTRTYKTLQMPPENEQTRSATPPMPEELRFGWRCMLTGTAEVQDGEKDGENGRRSAAAAMDMEDLLVSAVAVERGLSEWEGMLIGACDRAAKGGLERTAALCKAARITTAQIEAHCKEIGVQKKLTREQAQKVERFVQLMGLLEKMGVLQFEGEVAGRTLLGYDMISVMRQAEWQAAIEATCGAGKCFRAKSTVYEMLLKFGLGGHRDVALPKDTVLSGKSTEHKDHVLLCSSTFVFDEAKLARNVKRYTNSQTRMPCKGLCELLAAAERNV